MKKDGASEPRKFEPDQGWAWLVLLAAFLCNVTFDGIIFSFGVFYLEFLDYFQSGRGTTSWIGSVISGVYAIIGPLSSALANRYGCRKVTMAGSLLAAAGFLLSTLSPNIHIMIITYGIMGGVGFGLMYLCAYVMIGHYFRKYRAFATGIASCGSGVGTFIFAPLSITLIEAYGWKGGLWLISGIIINGLVLGALFRPVGESVASAHQSQDPVGAAKKKLIDWSLLKNPAFLIFCMSSFFCLIGFFIPFMYLPDFARRHGISREQGAFLVSIIGITNTIGRVACGWVSDKPWADPLKVYNGALIIGGSATIACAWLDSYPLLVVYAAIFGFSVAAYVSLCAIILVEFLGLERLSNSFGFLNMFRGIATFIGAPVAGFLFDSTGSYQMTFYVAGSAIAGAGVICLPLRVFGRCDGSPSEAIAHYEKERNLALSEFESQQNITRSLQNIPINMFDSTGSSLALHKLLKDREGREGSIASQSARSSPALSLRRRGLLGSLERLRSSKDDMKGSLVQLSEDQNRDNEVQIATISVV